MRVQLWHTATFFDLTLECKGRQSSWLDVMAGQPLSTTLYSPSPTMAPLRALELQARNDANCHPFIYGRASTAGLSLKSCRALGTITSFSVEKTRVRQLSI